jgi:hypothetical protein
VETYKLGLMSDAFDSSLPRLPQEIRRCRVERGRCHPTGQWHLAIGILFLPQGWAFVVSPCRGLGTIFSCLHLLATPIQPLCPIVLPLSISMLSHWPNDERYAIPSDARLDSFPLRQVRQSRQRR